MRTPELIARLEKKYEMEYNLEELGATIAVSKQPGEAFRFTYDTEEPGAIHVDHLYEVDSEGEYFYDDRHWDGAGGASFTGFTVSELFRYLEESQ